MSKTRQRKQSTYNEGVTDRKQGKKPFRHKYREYDDLYMNGYNVKSKDSNRYVDEQEQEQIQNK